MAEEVKVSLLEKSLSLSKNGGIYYGGARVEADGQRFCLLVLEEVARMLCFVLKIR